MARRSLCSKAPGSLIADPKLAVQLHRRQPRGVSGHEVSRPEPHRQRQSRPMQHRARRHRGLPPAPLALPQRPSRQLEGFRLPAPPTPKAVGPAAGGQGLPTRLVVPKSGLELLQGLGEIGSAHLTPPSLAAFGGNPRGTTDKMVMDRGPTLACENSALIPGPAAPETA